MNAEEIPILIVGGGACGLFSAIALSDLGIASLLVERHHTTSHLPKAHYLNQRTMEIFRSHGLADEIYDNGSPPENMRDVVWMTSLGGDGPLDRRIIHRMDAFGGGALEPTYMLRSPSRTGNLPQMLLEPLLRRYAEARPATSLRFGHELVSIEQESGSVTATILKRDNGEYYAVKAQYVVGCDGGRTLGGQLGVAMEGPSDMIDMVAVHISADLTDVIDDDRPLLRFFIGAEAGDWRRAGAIVPAGPDHWDRRSEDWVLYFALPPDADARTDEVAMMPHIRALLKIPDLAMRVHRVSHWLIECVVADRYRVGRVFLAGDAVHRHPPNTGLGLNTAIQDAHNLAWKLATVMLGDGGIDLLGTYETERQPVGVRNADWAFMAFQNHAIIDAAIGLVPEAPLEFNQHTIAKLFEESFEGETRRTRVAEAIATQRIEFQAHSLELGFAYNRGAVISDGSPQVREAPMGCEYQPTTRPGHRLPHAWIGRNGERISTHDLVPMGRFLLIAGPNGDDWVQAATEAASGIAHRLDAVRIGGVGGLDDLAGEWGRVREFDEDGAILVRPDSHVGWRSMTASSDPLRDLSDALGRLLGRDGNLDVPPGER